MDNNTISYYDNNAEKYFFETSNANMQTSYDLFLKNIKKGSYILDFGCGSGRDSKYFLNNGYRVKAIDASKEMCTLASTNIMQEVIHSEFKDLNDKNTFDGIWACASLLHISKKELLIVIKKMIEALKEEGYMYISLKNGTGEEIDSKGRFYSYYTKKEFDDIISLYENMKIVNFLNTKSVTNSNESKSWNNYILRKKKR